jgi:hypothetical protein
MKPISFIVALLGMAISAHAIGWEGPFKVRYVRYLYPSSSGTVIQIGLKDVSGVNKYAQYYTSNLNGGSEDRGKTITSMALAARAAGEDVRINFATYQNDASAFLEMSVGESFP